MNLAPIVLFVYNRPSHTLKTLEALRRNALANKSILYIFADGPKVYADESTIQKINETRVCIRKKQWCKEVIIYERDINLGLADSIVNGVTEIVNKYGKIIVLEDDIVTSKGFLKYMNDALNIYEFEEKVMHISGYMFPGTKLKQETFFVSATFCWGWATWLRAWGYFNSDSKYLFSEIRKNKQISKFDFNGRFALLDQLKRNSEGNLKTWAVKWHTSVFLNGGLSLLPNSSLVCNIGHDGTGENCPDNNTFSNKKLKGKITVIKQSIAENECARTQLSTLQTHNFSISKGLNMFFILNKIIKKGYSFLKIIQKKSYTPIKVPTNEKIEISKDVEFINSVIGDYSYISASSKVHYCDIGKFCSIGPNVVIGYGEHPTKFLSTSPLFYYGEKKFDIQITFQDYFEHHKRVTIRNDVWIGANVYIKNGVTVGNGAVIAAGAIIIEDIPDFAIVGGVPGKIIKFRFEKEIIEELLELRWWDWEIQKLQKNQMMFVNEDVKSCLEKLKNEI